MKSTIIVAICLFVPACSSDTIVQPQQVAESNFDHNGVQQNEERVVVKRKSPPSDVGGDTSTQNQQEEMAQLPKSGSSDMDSEDNMDNGDLGEDALAPILINGAALTCQIGDPDNLFCLLDVPNLQLYTWSLSNASGQMMDPSQYSVSEIANSDHWNVKITLLQSLTNIRAEASGLSTNSTGLVENHVHSSVLFNMNTDLSIREQLSRVYESPDYGDLTLSIDANNQVEGSWRDGTTVGDVDGTFNPETMSIRGRWVERPLGVQPYGGDVTFSFTLSPEGAITAAGEYSNDGVNNSVPWPLSPK